MRACPAGSVSRSGAGSLCSTSRRARRSPSSYARPRRRKAASSTSSRSCPATPSASPIAFLKEAAKRKPSPWGAPSGEGEVEVRGEGVLLLRGWLQLDVADAGHGEVARLELGAQAGDLLGGELGQRRAQGRPHRGLGMGGDGFL